MARLESDETREITRDFFFIETRDLDDECFRTFLRFFERKTLQVKRINKRTDL